MTAAQNDQLRRAAAENLLVAFQARAAAPEGTQGHVMAARRLEALCSVAARAGLASSADELEVIVADVAEQLPAPAGPLSTVWLMQARWLLLRRFRQYPRLRSVA